MGLNIKELLDFFDGKKDSQKGDANALMAILGEDLNVAIYKDFRMFLFINLSMQVFQARFYKFFSV